MKRKNSTTLCFDDDDNVASKENKFNELEFMRMKNWKQPRDI